MAKKHGTSLGGKSRGTPVGIAYNGSTGGASMSSLAGNSTLSKDAGSVVNRELYVERGKHGLNLCVNDGTEKYSIPFTRLGRVEEESVGDVIKIKHSKIEVSKPFGDLQLNGTLRVAGDKFKVDKSGALDINSGKFNVNSSGDCVMKGHLQIENSTVGGSLGLKLLNDSTGNNQLIFTGANPMIFMGADGVSQTIKGSSHLEMCREHAGTGDGTHQVSIYMRTKNSPFDSALIGLSDNTFRIKMHEHDHRIDPAVDAAFQPPIFALSGNPLDDDELGTVGFGIWQPRSAIDINNLETESLEIVDAGSVSASEQGWIQVKLGNEDGDASRHAGTYDAGGTTGYIRVYASK